jgi:DNA-binding response OmpR family regulator
LSKDNSISKETAFQNSHTGIDRQEKILIVDDEPDITAIMKKGLEQYGFKVDVYNDPEIALKEFKKDHYDLLLLDIKMPKITGFELYRRLKQLDPRPKVCFITAFEIYYDEFRRVFPKIKVSCFVRKPITIAELAKLVWEILEIKEEVPQRTHR